MARAWRGHVLYRGEHNMSGIERVSNACHRDGVAALAAAGKQADRITGRAVARRGSGEHHASQMWDGAQRDGAQWDGAQRDGAQWDGAQASRTRSIFRKAFQKPQEWDWFKTKSNSDMFLTHFERVPGTRLERVTMCP
eukprot:gene7968-biopygen15127